MAEIIREVDSPSNSLLAVILVIVIAIGGFLIWRYAANDAADDDTNDVINLEITNPLQNNATTTN